MCNGPLIETAPENHLTLLEKFNQNVFNELLNYALFYNN